MCSCANELFIIKHNLFEVANCEKAEKNLLYFYF